MDLLLRLIEQQELDITAVSLAQVTDQYLQYLRVVEQVRPDDLADFVAMAARLLLIKSRALLPRPPKTVEQEPDLGDDLARQLEAYRRFKQAAQMLQERDAAGAHMYPRMAPPPKLFKPRLDLDGTTLEHLIDALQALLSQEEAAEAGLQVPRHQITIEDQIARISDLLSAQSVLAFSHVLGDAPGRIQVIVTLLALLELIRSGRVRVHQNALFGEIQIEQSRPPTDEAASQPAEA